MCTSEEVADYQPPSPQNESNSEREDRESALKHWYSLSIPQRTPEHFFIVDGEGRAQEAPPISEGAPAITGSWRKEVIFFAGIVRAQARNSVVHKQTKVWK